jgi:hypothetical protein
MRGGLKTRRWYLQWGRRRLGVGTSRVHIGGEPYLDRFILFLGGPTLRIHRFWRGDDDRASHTHPFWFVTLPLSFYIEEVYSHGVPVDVRPVWRLSFRSATFEHKVIWLSRLPLWTIVLTGTYSDDWGFYPEPGKYVPNQEYLS